MPAFASYWLRDHLLDRIAVFGNPWPDASGCDAVTRTRRNGSCLPIGNSPSDIGDSIRNNCVLEQEAPNVVQISPR